MQCAAVHVSKNYLAIAIPVLIIIDAQASHIIYTCDIIEGSYYDSMSVYLCNIFLLLFSM